MTGPRSLLAWSVIAAAAGLLLGATVRPPLLSSVAAAGVLAALLLAVHSDLRTRRIPNRVTIPGLAAALACAAAGGVAPGVAAIAGAALAGGYFLAFALAAPGRLGIGDVKLAAFGGSVVGLSAVPLLLVAATLSGGIWALVLLTVRRRTRDSFAYGPAIALGVIAALARSGLVVS